MREPMFGYVMKKNGKTLHIYSDGYMRQDRDRTPVSLTICGITIVNGLRYKTRGGLAQSSIKLCQRCVRSYGG